MPLGWLFNRLPTRQMVILLSRRLVDQGYDIEDSIKLLREDIEYYSSHKELVEMSICH